MVMLTKNEYDNDSAVDVASATVSTDNDDDGASNNNEDKISEWYIYI